MVIISGFLFFLLVFAAGSFIAAVIYGASNLLGLLSIIPGNAILSFSESMSLLDIIIPAIFLAGVIALAFDKLGVINLQSLKPSKRNK